jgi:hypothetical protein
MKKYITYLRVTVDYEIECEVPDNLNDAQTDDLIELQAFNLISGNSFDFDLEELEYQTKSKYLVNKELEGTKLISN